MPINWPSAPATNDTYSFAGITWKYDGYGWQVVAGPTPSTRTILGMALAMDTIPPPF